MVEWGTDRDPVALVKFWIVEPNICVPNLFVVEYNDIYVKTSSWKIKRRKKQRKKIKYLDLKKADNTELLI